MKYAAAWIPPGSAVRMIRTAEGLAPPPRGRVRGLVRAVVEGADVVPAGRDRRDKPMTKTVLRVRTARGTEVTVPVAGQTKFESWD